MLGYLEETSASDYEPRNDLNYTTHVISPFARKGGANFVPIRTADSASPTERCPHSLVRT